MSVKAAVILQKKYLFCKLQFSSFYCSSAFLAIAVIETLEKNGNVAKCNFI